jgi:hypothetical protein
MTHAEHFRKGAVAIIMAATMTAAAVSPIAAIADPATPNTPSVGAQTGTGQTDLNMILQHTSEFGGTEDTNNPDTNPVDGLGDNLAFTVPSSINYVVKADGTLIGPNAGAAFIENRSNFKTHVSSVYVKENSATDSTFKFVANANTASDANAVELHFGPADDQLNAAEYVATGAAGKKAVTDATKWNMAATNGEHTGTSDRGDEVQITTSGKVKNISNDITSQKKFGEIHWFVTPGEAS